MKKLLIIGTIFITVLLCTSFKNSDGLYSTYLYSEDGRILYLQEETKDDLEKIKNEQLTVGWYEEPQVLLYALNKQEYFNESEVEDQLTVGWFKEPVTTLHSLDYRTEVVPLSKVEEQLSVGWYKTKAEVDQINNKKKVKHDEKVLLAKVIYAEASDNNIEDRRAVGVVVVNRVASSTYPNSLHAVVYQKGQYSCIKSSKFKKNPPQECLDIAEAILSGERYGIPSNVIFQSQGKQGLGVWKKIGVHYYCYGRI